MSGLKSIILLEKYDEQNFVLPCVVDAIDYEKHLVLDVIQEEGTLFRIGQELTYKGVEVSVEKKLYEKPVQTEAVNPKDDLSKVRYYCTKK